MVVATDVSVATIPRNTDNSRKVRSSLGTPGAVNQEYIYRIFDRALAAHYTQQILGRRRRQQIASATQTQTQESAPEAASTSAMPILRPRMALCDDPENSHIEASLELPGVKQKDIAIELRGGCLVVSGERRSPFPADVVIDEVQRRYPVQELKYGKFERILSVPPNTQASDIKGHMEEGMLVLSWPRHPVGESVSQRIELS